MLFNFFTFLFVAIKIGRYTIEHKTSNIKEAKCLESKKKNRSRTETSGSSLFDIPMLDTIISTDNKDYTTLNSVSTNGSFSGTMLHIHLLLLVEDIYCISM